MLAIIIPVFNEIATLPRVIRQVSLALPQVPKTIIIVDDGSTDGTSEWLRMHVGEGCDAATIVETIDPVASHGSDAAAVTVQAHLQPRNRGKGAAVRHGLSVADADVMVIQDADLEYDPADWQAMYDLIAVRKVADVVYGSRFYGAPHTSLRFHHYAANRLISRLFSILYDQTLTDVETCYKMFTRAVRDSLRLSADDYGFEVQFSAQVVRPRRWRIFEVGICYYGRTSQEGKKIGWRDGLKALWYLARFRVTT